MKVWSSGRVIEAWWGCGLPFHLLMTKKNENENNYEGAPQKNKFMIDNSHD